MLEHRISLAEFEREEIRVLFGECLTALALARLAVLEMDALLASIDRSREEREHRRLTLCSVVVGADGVTRGEV